MTAYVMMRSERQERMLMVLKPEKEAVARAKVDPAEIDATVAAGEPAGRT